MALLATLAVVAQRDAGTASTLNSATLFRYPWIAGETRQRSQGQFGTVSHFSSNGLQYAVDWGLAGQSHLLFAPAAGTLRCHQEGAGGTGVGFGNWISIYNSFGDVTAILAHVARDPDAAECYPFPVDTDVSVLQGQFIGIGDHTGHVEPPDAAGDHIHFQANAGYSTIGGLTSTPFTMSDHAPDGGGVSFSDISASDGPSDNAGVAYNSQSPVSVDSSILNEYNAHGDASSSWWNVGAPLAANGEPCIYANNPFVHSCATLAGGLTVQNYIRFDGRLAGIGRSGASAFLVSGANWRLWSAPYHVGDWIANQLGAPTQSESVSSPTLQSFAGGVVRRYLSRTLQDVYIGSTWRASYYFQTLGPECYDMDGNGTSTLGDVLADLVYVGTQEGKTVPNANGVTYSPRYAVRHKISVALGDVLVVLSTSGTVCSP